MYRGNKVSFLGRLFQKSIKPVKTSPLCYQGLHSFYQLNCFCFSFFVFVSFLDCWYFINYRRFFFLVFYFLCSAPYSSSLYKLSNRCIILFYFYQNISSLKIVREIQWYHYYIINCDATHKVGCIENLFHIVILIEYKICEIHLPVTLHQKHTAVIVSYC